MGNLDCHDLNSYISKYSLNTFVETGTGLGQGISYALKHGFSKLYSIEFMLSLFNECSSKISDSRLTLINSNSVDGLIKVSSELTQDSRVMYWLDAHFPGADFHLNDYSFLSDVKRLYLPLEFELEAIFSSRDSSKDVFIIDDLRIYEYGPYELGNWDRKHLIPDLNLDFLYKIVGNTHNISKDMRQQGFLILTPK